MSKIIYNLVYNRKKSLNKKKRETVYTKTTMIRLDEF